MDMDQSLRDTLSQLVSLQSQQLNAINNLASNSSAGGQTPQFNNSYMNHSPDYMPPMMPFSANTQLAGDKFDAYSGQVANTASLSDMVFANKSKLSSKDRAIQASDMGARAGNAAIAGSGFVAAAATDIGLMAVAPGLMGGIAAGAVGGAVVGGLFDIGLKQNAQHSAYNKYLQRESYRFINPANSTNERGVAGLGQDDRFEAASFLRHFNTESKISDQETSMLLEKFTEGNLLKGTKDLEGFRDKIKSLTKYVKQSALLLNESFEDISGLMSDMQKSGIDVKNINYMSAKNKVIGSFTGMSGSDVMRYATGTGANMVQGTNYQAGIQSERLGGGLLYMGGLYDQAMAGKDFDPKLQQTYTAISNMGGIKNATTVMSDVQNRMLGDTINANASVNFFDYNKGSNSWAFNRNSFNEFLKGGGDIDSLSTSATSKLNSDEIGMTGRNAWMRNRSTYLRNSLDNDQSNNLVQRLLGARKAGSGNDEIRNKALSYEDQISLLMGDNSIEGKLYGQLLDFQKADAGELSRKAKAYTYQANMLAGMNASRPGFGYEVKNTWEKFKDEVGDAFVPFGEAATRVSQSVSDWWYGKEVKMDRSMIDSGFSADSVRKEGKILAEDVIKGVREGMADAKARGFNVKDDVLKMFSASDSDMADWKTKVIEYKREVYKSLDDMGSEVKKYAKTIESSTAQYGVSQSTVVGMIRNGGQNMGMGAESIKAITDQIGSEVYQSGGSSKIDAITKRLGGLITEYGGNEGLANAALATSKATVDAALSKYGLNASELRRSGNNNQLSGVNVNDLKKFFTLGNVKDIEVLDKWKGLGNVIGFDETFKQGLASNPQTVKRIRDSANMLGITDINAMAALITTESEGSNIVSTNSGGSRDWGPAQLNDAVDSSGNYTASIKQYIGQSITLPNGKTVTVNNDNWKTNEDLNVHLGEMIFSDSLKRAKGNAPLAYSLYNAWSIGKGEKKKYIMDLLNQRFKNQGVAPEDMNQAIRNMSPQEVVEFLRVNGGEQVSRNVGRYVGNLAPGALPGKDAATIEREVLQNEAGKMFTSEEAQSYREGTFGRQEWSTNTSFTSAGMKDLWGTMSDIEKRYPRVITEGLRSSSTFGDGFSMDTYWLTDKSREAYKEKLYGGLAKSWGIDYDGGIGSFNKVSSKMRSESNRIDKMVSEYNAARTPEEKRSTAWGKLGTVERSGLIQLRRASGILRNEKDPVDIEKYTTAEDKEEFRKINRNLIDSDKYNPNYTDEGGNYKEYMNWLNSSGDMEYTTPSGRVIRGKRGGTVGDLLAEIDKNIATIETESKSAREGAEELLAGDLLLYDGMSKGETKKLIASALDGDPQAIEKLKAFQKTLQADQSGHKPNIGITEAQSVIGSIRWAPGDGPEISIGMPENKGSSTNWSSTAGSMIERTLELSGKLNYSELRGLRKKRGDIEDYGTRINQYSQFGGTFMSMITGNVEDGQSFTKRMMDSVGENFEGLDSGIAPGIISGGTTEIINALSKLKGDDKGIERFINNLKEHSPSTTTTETVKRLQNAFGKGDQKALRDIIETIIGEWGAGMSAGKDPAQAIKDSEKTSQDLLGALEDYTKQGETMMKLVTDSVIQQELANTRFRNSFNVTYDG